VTEKTRTEVFDVGEHLRNPQEISAYLDACIIESDGDPAFIAEVLAEIARIES